MRWAIVEQMGHRTFAGEVGEVELCGVKMLRVRMPAVPSDDDRLELPEEVKDLGAASLFAISYTTEAAVLELRQRQRAWRGLNEVRQLLGPVEEDQF